MAARMVEVTELSPAEPLLQQYLNLKKEKDTGSKFDGSCFVAEGRETVSEQRRRRRHPPATTTAATTIAPPPPPTAAAVPRRQHTTTRVPAPRVTSLK